MVITNITPKTRLSDAGYIHIRLDWNWEHHIRNERDTRKHVEYCWLNPVKHGLVERPTHWPHSSIHRDIRLGTVPPEWQ